MVVGNIIPNKTDVKEFISVYKNGIWPSLIETFRLFLFKKCVFQSHTIFYKFSQTARVSEWCISIVIVTYNKLPELQNVIWRRFHHLSGKTNVYCWMTRGTLMIYCNLLLISFRRSFLNMNKDKFCFVFNQTDAMIYETSFTIEEILFLFCVS